MRRKLVAANWKMHKTIGEARAFADALASNPPGDCDLVVFPPFLALPAVAGILSDTGVGTGAQDFYWESQGAFTGEVSLDMIRDAGAEWVLVGHSERRHVLGESNETVARKLAAAIAFGARAILCVGERIEEREAGEAHAVVSEQLRSAFEGVDATAAQNVVIAYEPVWAIGTGRTATPDDAEEMHQHARNWLAERFGDEVAAAVRIQYGGSVKPANAGELMAREDIDGALIGGASLEVDSFLAIARAVP